NSRLPPDTASKMPMCVITPQLAVGAGKVTTPLFDVVPPVPDDAVVLPADCVPAQFASALVIACRAYEPPETSVPPPVSDGAAVNNPMYTVAGGVYVCALSSQSMILFSRKSVIALIGQSLL